MYVSDYMFVAAAEHWTKLGWNTDLTKDYRAATSDNWMYNGLFDRTITRSTFNNRSAFYINFDGSVQHDSLAGRVSAIRPCFYLESSVVKEVGSGTASDPMHLL